MEYNQLKISYKCRSVNTIDNLLVTRKVNGFDTTRLLRDEYSPWHSRSRGTGLDGRAYRRDECPALNGWRRGQLLYNRAPESF